MTVLSSLPAPVVLESLDYEAILAELIADASARFAAAGVAYEVGQLETDPVVIVLQAAAYREVLLRGRVNDAAVRANLIAFASGADLDHQAAFYGVARLEGEGDEALRERVVLAIHGRSTAGPEERYAYIARSADVRVKEVAVYRVDGGPHIRVAVRSNDNEGVPTQDILEAVEAAVTAKGVAVVSDDIEVVSGVTAIVDVAAKVWLLPDAPKAVFDALEAHLRSAWDQESSMGFDLNPSWIKARLHVAGVARVEMVTPTEPVVVDDSQAVALGEITLEFAGRAR